MSVHLRERELLAQRVTLPIVGLGVDRSLVEKRFVQPVEFLTNGFLLPLDFRDPLLRVALEIAPRVQHAILHEPHVAGSRLQSCELVVVRVVVAAPLRPARCQRFAAGLATHVAAQREIRIVALPRRCDLVATV
ncbi:MAG: hypothetical protein AUF76_13500 [Acidobacteria bacterium 13_1_20CM_2_65_9]|nr:MAG: hypothetical protein AUF76_13500 [Acidobacteria bacterium 13_1_20CM_2_65_9]